MKKLMITTAAMVLSFASVAITPEEMLANKDYAGVENYCKTNKTHDALVNYVRVGNFNDWMVYMFTNNSHYAYWHGLRVYSITNGIVNQVEALIDNKWMNEYPKSLEPARNISDDTDAKNAYDKFLAVNAKYNLIWCMRHSLNFEESKVKEAILNSTHKITNYSVMSVYVKEHYDYVMSFYNHDLISLETAFKKITAKNGYDKWSSKTQWSTFKYYRTIVKDIVKYSTIETNVYEVSFKADYWTDPNTVEYRTIAYNRLTTFGYKLNLAVSINDIDKIIDCLLVADDTITADQVNAIIKPINAVPADYRKDDILTALKNINSRCTIKLYDDQATWEPIISKIRAMIDVRK